MKTQKASPRNERVNREQRTDFIRLGGTRSLFQREQTITLPFPSYSFDSRIWTRVRQILFIAHKTEAIERVLPPATLSSLRSFFSFAVEFIIFIFQHFLRSFCFEMPSLLFRIRVIHHSTPAIVTDLFRYSWLESWSTTNRATSARAIGSAFSVASSSMMRNPPGSPSVSGARLGQSCVIEQMRVVLQGLLDTIFRPLSV